MGRLKKQELEKVDRLREACAAAPPCSRCGGEVDDPDDGMCGWCNHITDKDD
jgi:hypothetical protein